MKPANKLGYYSNGKALGKLSLILGGFLMFMIFNSSCKKSNTNPSGGNTTPNLQLVANNMAAPLTLAEAPDNSKRLFIVDQVGKIWIIYPDSTKAPSVFLDISSKMVSLNTGYDERGLLGLAFHPRL